MKLLSLKIRNTKTASKPQNIKRTLQGIKTVGYLLFTGKNKVHTVKGQPKVYKSVTGRKLAILAIKAKQAVKKAQDWQTAFTKSLKLITLERAIQAKKQLLKYGYSFEKTVAVSKAYIALRSFKYSLPKSIVNLLF